METNLTEGSGQWTFCQTKVGAVVAANLVTDIGGDDGMASGHVGRGPTQSLPMSLAPVYPLSTLIKIKIVKVPVPQPCVLTRANFDVSS